MKKGLALALVLLCAGHPAAAAEHDDGSVVTWRNLVGNITAPGIDNPVAQLRDDNGLVIFQISSGTLPWTTRSGSASVDLVSGAVRFTVNGLVLNGGNATGTAGIINEVSGTLVCNPGSSDPAQPQTINDTPGVALSANGNARFSGQFIDSVPSPCGNPLFLIRIGPDFFIPGAVGRWLATGVEPSFGTSHGSNHDQDRDRR